MDKFALRQEVLARLAEDLLQAEQAVRTAHEAATHEENIAENKYDTLGLEAIGMRPAAFAKFVAKESDATLAVARRIGAAKK